MRSTSTFRRTDLVDTSSFEAKAEFATWIDRVLRDGRIDIEEPGDVVRRIVTSPRALQVLADDKEGQALLKAAEPKKRADSLVTLRRVTEDPEALEADLQHALEDKPWIFGGRFRERC